MIKKILAVSGIIILVSCTGPSDKTSILNSVQTSPGEVVMEGVLAGYLEKGKQFLVNYIKDGNTFSDHGTGGSVPQWSGGHAGEWLYAASKAAERTRDPKMKKQVIAVADSLLTKIKKSNTLHLYKISMTEGIASATIIPYHEVQESIFQIAGLLEACKASGDDRYLSGAEKITGYLEELYSGDSLSSRGSRVLWELSGTGFIGELIDLYTISGTGGYLDFARVCVENSKTPDGLDSDSGQITQVGLKTFGNKDFMAILNFYTGVARMYVHTGLKKYLTASEGVWKSIKTNHVISEDRMSGYGAGEGYAPDTKTDTVSVLYDKILLMRSWQLLNVELLQITGNARYAEELDKIAYGKGPAPMNEGFNYLMSDEFPGNTNDYDSCRLIQIISREEMARVAVTMDGDYVYLNILGPCSLEYTHSMGSKVKISEVTDYPLDGRVSVKFGLEEKEYVQLHILIPSRADTFAVNVKGVHYLAKPGQYSIIDREWKNGDVAEIYLSKKRNVKAN